MLNIRALAVDILIEVFENGEYLSRILSGVLSKYAYLEKHDRAFLTRLTMGTAERLIEMDAVIDSFSKVPVKKQKPYIRNVLRMSVYQLLYMDSVPASAAVNEAVKLARKKGFSGLSGFVNGVLRSISKNAKDILEKRHIEEGSSVKDISVYYSVPEWIVSEYKKAAGDNDNSFEKLCSSLSSFFTRAGDITLRINTLKISCEDYIALLNEAGITVKHKDIPDAKDVVIVSGVDTVGALPGYDKGYFYVQDIASAMAANMAGVRPGDEVLDVCAAPGGKSFYASVCGGRVTSRDISEKKVAIIREGANRLGLNELKAQVGDATVFDEDCRDKYDIVLCDVPCSGLGVLSKKPELKYRVRQEDVEALADQALVIAQNAAGYVKSGGRLLFSTCTVTEAENHANVMRLLGERSDLTLVEERLLLPTDINDGFFMALLRKTDKISVSPD